MEEVARTARWTAAWRAREHERADRLFEDPYAALLAGPEGLTMLDHMGRDASAIVGKTNHALLDRLRPRPDWKPSRQDDPILAIRTRFFDDYLRAVARDGPVRQVVLLAAGMDSRAYRLDWQPGTTLFEVDQPVLNQLKERLLSQHGAQPRCDLRRLNADLRTNWSELLLAEGFDAQRPSAWLIEGLVSYLEPAAVDTLLDSVSQLARPGSTLGIDMVNTHMLTSPLTRHLVEKLARQGTPWRFGTNRPATLLGRLGWRATVTEFGSAKANFGRWPFPRVPRLIPGIPRGFLITAVRK